VVRDGFLIIVVVETVTVPIWKSKQAGEIRIKLIRHKERSLKILGVVNSELSVAGVSDWVPRSQALRYKVLGVGGISPDNLHI
jgi:hypothetical protein